MTNPDEVAVDYWGEASAQIAETPSQWQDDPDECAQGCPPQCRHDRAANEERDHGRDVRGGR